MLVIEIQATFDRSFINFFQERNKALILLLKEILINYQLCYHKYLGTVQAQKEKLFF